jgi:hypothetical protein
MRTIREHRSKLIDGLMSAMGGKLPLRVSTASGTLTAMRLSLIALMAFLFTDPASAAAGRCVPTLPAWVSPLEQSGLQLRPNTVGLRGRELRWNGMTIDEKQLSAHLRSAAKLNPLPPLVMRSDYNDCAFAHRVERLLKASYPCSGGRCSRVTSR